jgi:hemerythrin
MRVEWSDDLSLGIEEIDADHMKLVEMLNNLFVACFAGQGPVVLRKILDDLITYTQNHFESEETCMERDDYPDLDEHRSEHEKLMAQMLDIHDSFRAGGTLDSHVKCNT